MTIEEELKQMMIKKSGSVNKFAQECGLSTSTVATLFSRGVKNANVNTIIKICQKLHISVDELANGRIASPLDSDWVVEKDGMEILAEFRELNLTNRSIAAAYVKGLRDSQNGDKNE